MTTCKNCNENNFDILEGVRICNVCGLQDDNFIQLETGIVYEDFNFSQFLTIKDDEDANNVLSDANIDEKNNWTSYNFFNIILKSWTKLMIEKGASQSFKDVVMRLWMLYLRRLNVAFTGNRKDEIQVVPFHIHKKDYAIVYGIDNDKRKAETSEDRLKKKLKKLEASKIHQSKYIQIASAILSQSLKEVDEKAASMTGSSEDVLCPSNNNGNAKNAKKQIKLGVDKATMSYLKKCNLVSSDFQGDIKPETRTSAFKKSTGARNFVRCHPVFITMEVLLAFFYLAILISKENFLLSDILRLCREEYLPYFTAQYLCPDIKGYGHDIFKKMKGYPFQENILFLSGKLAIFLSLDNVPLLSTEFIVNRMLNMLQLPKSLYPCVCQIIDTSLKENSHLTLSIPDIEVKAVLAILLSLKCCYGLNDYSECVLNTAAEKINGCLDTANSSCKLFSWSSWQRHMSKLIWFCSVVHPSFYARKSNNSYCNNSDTEHFFNYFWSQGVFRKVKVDNSRTDHKVTNKLFELIPASAEDFTQSKFFYSPIKDGCIDIVTEYLNNSEIPKNDKFVTIAKELKSTDFSQDNFNWPFELKKVNKILYKCHIDMFLTYAVENEDEPNEQEIRIPMPCSNYVMWLVPKDARGKLLKYSEFSSSFYWLVDLLSNIFSVESLKLVRDLRKCEMDVAVINSV